MQGAAAIRKIGFYAISAQFLLLLLALTLGAALEFGKTFTLLFLGSVFVGLVGLTAGIALCVLLRQPRWLAVSGAAICILAFSALFGIAIGGVPVS